METRLHFKFCLLLLFTYLIVPESIFLQLFTENGVKKLNMYRLVIIVVIVIIVGVINVLVVTCEKVIASIFVRIGTFAQICACQSCFSALTSIC